VPSRRLTREEQRSRTRTRLIETAARVFAHRGFAGASIDEIAEEAGFTKGAVYSNFASKDELFLSVLEEHLGRRLRDVRQTVGESETLDDVRLGGRELADLVEMDRDVWLLFVEFWTHAARDPEVGRRFAGVYETWREAIGDLIAQRFERLDIPLPAPRADLAAAAIALAEGHALQKLIDPERLTSEAYGDMLAYLVAGMAVAGLGLDTDALERLRQESVR
jgi:AcrR family transcriptional regulator